MARYLPSIYFFVGMFLISCGKSDYPAGSRFLSFLGVSQFQSQMAFNLLNDGKHEESLKLCFKLIKEDHPDGYLFAGWNYIELKNYDEAIKFLTLANGRSNGVSEDLLGDIYAAKQDHIDIQKALEMYQQSGQQGCVSSFFKRGRMFYEGDLIKKDLFLAEKEFLKVAFFENKDSFHARFNFDKPQAYYYLGIINLERGDLNKAEDFLEKASKSQFAHKDASQNLAELKMKAGPNNELD